MSSKEVKMLGPTEYEMVKLDKLVPYKKNSKIHTEENIKGLMASITQYGLSHPIEVDRHMVIIGGHGRRLACQRLDMKYVKVQIRDDLTAKQVKELRISENKTASVEYDSAIMLEELSLIGDGFDIQALGFSDEEYEKLTADYTEVDLSALTNDLDGEIDKQAKQGEKDIAAAGEKEMPVISALGFKSVPVSASRSIAMFIGALQDDYGLTPEESFVKFASDFMEK